MITLLILSLLGVTAMVFDFFPFKRFLPWKVIAGLGLVLGLLAYEYYNPIEIGIFKGMLQFNHLAILFSAGLVVLCLLWVLLAWPGLQSFKHRTEFYALLIFSLCGGLIMVSYTNLVMLFLGIEILSIPLYILAGSNQNSLASNEASFKYFLMGAFASGFLLFGLTLIYGATGSFALEEIGKSIVLNKGALPSFFYAGIVLILAGLAFKVSAVPFHFWAPDVYQGAPHTITAFMATIVKMAAFGAFYRLFSSCFAAVTEGWSQIVWVLAALSLLVGNISAVYQVSFKRLLAFSGIAHAGYILLAILALTKASGQAILLYTLAYGIASTTAFLIFILVNKESEGTAGENFDRFNGLAKRNPLAAFALTVAMLSLAGIPPTAGFFAKFSVFASALDAGYKGLVLIAILASLVGIYIYLRVVIAAYFKQPHEGEGELVLNTQHQFLIWIGILLTLLLGLFPNLILGLAT